MFKEYLQGDIVDRGPDCLIIYEFFEKLRKEAEEVGGKVKISNRSG